MSVLTPSLKKFVVGTYVITWSVEVGKLNKAFYGLPEAACIWREDLNKNWKPWVMYSWKWHRHFPAQICNRHLGNRLTCRQCTGICSSEEEESRLKAGIQKFYYIKEKDTSKPFKVLSILSQEILNKGWSNYTTQVHRIRTPVVRHGGLQLSGHTHRQGHASTEWRTGNLWRQKEVSSSYWVSNICHNVNKARHRVHHPVPVPIEQNPYSTWLERGRTHTQILEGIERPRVCVQEKAWAIGSNSQSHNSLGFLWCDVGHS